jgi:hypothetical protein
MPHYFFDLIDGQPLMDRTGQQLPDLLAARDEAARILGRQCATIFPEMVRPGSFWCRSGTRLVRSS